ncbi:MAG: cytochrome o ubiquinol oxidase subunit IV [Hyphomicrobiales bacterium]
METSSGIPVERTIRPYLIGIVAALVLTAIPFGLVAAGTLPRETTLVIIAIFAVVQILVHLRFFLHIGIEATPRENLIALAFAAVLIFLMVGGSMWIMFDLYHRMMV